MSEITLFYAIDAEERRIANLSRFGPSTVGSLNGLLADRINRLRQIRRAELPDTRSVILAICVGEDAAEVICNGAKRNEADMIVITAHGRGNHPDRVPGHVAAAVAHRAPCPVMVVRGYDVAEPLGITGSISSPGSLSSAGALERTGTTAY